MLQEFLKAFKRSDRDNPFVASASQVPPTREWLNRQVQSWRKPSALQIALAVSLALHVLLLALRFVSPTTFNRLFQDTPLEVVLLNSGQEQRPEVAQALAQLNSAGGGEADKGISSTPLVATSLTQLGDAADDAQKQIDAVQEQQMLLLSRLKSQLEVMPKPERSGDKLSPEAKAQEDQRRKLSNLLGAIEKRIVEENARPKKRFMSPATRVVVYAQYYDGVRRAIEDNGTRNFPQAAGKKLYGELTMSVTINHTGEVLQTEVSETSGNLLLDRRAQAIVRAAGPFGGFSPDMRKLADQLVVVSRFKFAQDDSLETKMLAPTSSAESGPSVAGGAAPGLATGGAATLPAQNK